MVFVFIGGLILLKKYQKFIFDGREFIAFGVGHFSHFFLDFIIWKYFIESNEDLILVDSIVAVPTLLFFAFLMFTGYKRYEVSAQIKNLVERIRG